MASTTITVAQALAAYGVTPSENYTGVEMTDDFILAIKLGEAASESEWTVCQDHITSHSASLNPSTEDKTYIRTGVSTTKTQTQRSFSIAGDRNPGDAFQDYALGHAVMFGTGQDCIVEYIWFSIRTGKGEKGQASIVVNEDAAGDAGTNATFGIDLRAVRTPDAYTYSAGA